MQEIRSINPQIICGVDEAGRGPLAGPVTAAAVILPENFPVTRLRDSKKLSADERERLAEIILSDAVAYGLGWAWPDEIDRINILWAAMLAMQRAVSALQKPVATILNAADLAAGSPVAVEAAAARTAAAAQAVLDSPEQTGIHTYDRNPASCIIPELILVDGNRCPDFGTIPSRAEIQGDDRFPEIMAASILAKTARDDWMVRYDEHNPGYGFRSHKGYPTPAHREAIRRLGPSPIHRLSFRGANGLSE
ncbi:MAG: ribonuclease HII [Spirochaeta sp.]